MSNINRRALVASAATLAAIATPAAAQCVLAAPDDPIAAIEDHRRAWFSLKACLTNDENDKALEDRWNAAIDAAEEALLD